MFSERLDFRLVLLGSMLPDILDKPIGGIFLFETFRNGRIFGHTLCFLLFLLALGFLRRRSAPLILSFGTFMHLLLDKMWLCPQTLLWPAFGLRFPEVQEEDFIALIPEFLARLTSDPEVFIPEIIGGSILAWFAVRLFQTRSIRAFLKNGLVLWR